MDILTNIIKQYKNTRSYQQKDEIYAWYSFARF